MDKTVLITGASSGIGLHLCKHILINHADCIVIAVGRRMSLLDEVARIYPTRIILVRSDISDENGVAELLNTVKGIEHIDIIVHSAAVVEPLNRLNEITYADWKNAQQINLDAPIFITLGLLDKLCNSRVMFITSDVELRPVIGASSYCISKMALHMAWACLQAEIPAETAVFGLVAPGNVDTPMQARIRATAPEKLPIAPTMISVFEQGKCLSPEYVAGFLAWLLFDVSEQKYAEKIWNIYTDMPTLSPTFDTPSHNQ